MSSSTSSTTQTTLNRRQLYRLTNGILDAHSFHFITISLLFLPFTFAASTAAQFYSSSATTTDATAMFDPFNLLLIKTIISSSQILTTLLAFFCFIVLPTVAGIALITYSANQAIHRKPLTFSSALKSLSSSYTPLLHTFITASVALVVIFLAFTLSPIAFIEAIKPLLGFDSGRLFHVSIFVNTVVSYALAFAIVFLIVIWGSASAITVLESKSGFETLRQSANQSNEFRRHSFSIVYLTGFLIIPSVLWSQKWGSTEKWMLILHVGAVYLQTSLMMAFYVVANTVLYVQYKAAMGEEVAMTTEKGEVSGEYVRLVVVNDNEGDDVHDDVAKGSGKGGFTYMFYLLLVVWIILFFGVFLFPLN